MNKITPTASPGLAKSPTTSEVNLFADGNIESGRMGQVWQIGNSARSGKKSNRNISKNHNRGPVDSNTDIKDVL